MSEEPICVVCNIKPALKILHSGRRHGHIDDYDYGRTPHIPTHKKQCRECAIFCKWLVTKSPNRATARRYLQGNRNRRNVKLNHEHCGTDRARNLFDEVWRELEKEIHDYTISPATPMAVLIAEKEMYQGVEAYILVSLGRRSNQQVLNPPTSVDSLIEALGPNMKNHDKFLRELYKITEGDINLEEKMESLSSLSRKWGNSGDNEFTDSWLSRIQQAKIKVAEKEVVAEIDRRKEAETERRRQQFSKLGPDMPQSLADAMATEMIPQGQAVQIFREGWHRDALTSRIMAALLAGDLDFEKASWMQQNANHERLMEAILSGSMDIDLAKHLFTIGFGVNPDATGAVLDGNEIELVAAMYGIAMPVVQEEIEEEPELEVEPEPMVEETKEWRGRFDED